MNSDFYYILVEEWNYPTESGREPIQVTFEGDEIVACLKFAEDKCKEERKNFFEVTGCDVLTPHMIDNEGGFIITSKMGLDEYYYAVRIITMKNLGV